MKIKIIASGSTTLQRMINNWGVAFLIGKDILFDTFGRADTFLKNVEKERVALENIRHIFLSHEHWDHINGLWSVLEKSPKATVYICSSFSSEFKNRLKELRANVIEVRDLMQTSDGIFTTGEISGEYANNPIYEQSLIIKSQGKISIITGCAHPGIVNIVKHAKKNFQEPIHLVMGGFHMIGNLGSENRQIANELKSLGIEKIAPMHCTGEDATRVLKHSFREDCLEMKEGDVFEI